MKLQRYDLEVYLTSQFPVPEKDENGDWCRAEDVAVLEAENERLRAKLARYENDGTTHAAGCWAWGPKHYECALTEIERLKAQYKVLSAEEVTEPGWYWLKWGGWSWNIVRVSFYAGEIVVHSGSEVYDSPEDGLFIGPLSPPEV